MMDEGLSRNSTDLSSPAPDLNGPPDRYSSDIPEAERYVESILLSLISLVAAVANGSLWVVVLGVRSLRRQSSMLLLLCVSLADLLVSCVSMPITVITIAKARWMYGEATCTVIGFVNMLTLVSSVMSLGIISINRYVKICRPKHYHRLFTLPRVCLMFSGVWCLSAFLSSPPLLGWCRYDYLPRQSFCFCDWASSVSYTFFMVLVCFGGPLSMMTFCNVRILQTFRLSQRNIQRSSQGSALSTPAKDPPAKATPAKATPAKKTPVKESLAKETLARETPIRETLTKETPAKETCKPQSGEYPAITVASVEEKILTPSAVETFLVGSSVDPQPPGTSVQGDSAAALPVAAGVTKSDPCCLDDSVESVPDEEVNVHLIIVPEGLKPAPDSASSRSNPRDPLSSSSGPPSQGSDLQNSSPAEKGSRISSPEAPTRHILYQQLKEKQRMEEFQLALSLMVVVAVFVVCWLPFCITMFLSVFVPHVLSRPVDMFSLLLGYSNSCFNPLIYSIRNRQVKEGYRALWRSFWSCCGARGHQGGGLSAKNMASVYNSKSSA